MTLKSKAAVAIVLTAVMFLSGFAVLGGAYAGPPPYAVTFTETGLASGVMWSVEQISGANSVTNVTVGSYPAGIAYDSLNHTMFVANQLSQNVSVLSGTSVVHTIATVDGNQKPMFVTYDNASNTIWVASDGGILWVIGASNYTLLKEINTGIATLGGIAYDPANNDIYVSADTTSTVVVVSASTYATVATLTVGENPGSIAYDPTNGNMYVADSKNITIISGSSNTVVGTVAIASQAISVLYDSADGDIWIGTAGSIMVLSPSTDTITATVPLNASGSDASIGYDSYRNLIYETVSNDTLAVVSPSSYQIVDWLPVEKLADSIVFNPYNNAVYVTDMESAAVSVITSVAIHTTYESATSDVQISDPNGTYSYIVRSSSPYYEIAQSTGSYVVDGAPVSLSVSFVHLYVITFSTSGLLLGTLWSVSLNGKGENSTSASIAFMEPNGSYPFIVRSIEGYTVSPASGEITVSGSNISRIVSFQPIAPPESHKIVFTETGLPSGTEWSVVFNGVVNASYSSTISFTVTNGSYSYTVSQLAGYSSTPASGLLTVSGNTNITVVYKRTSSGGFIIPASSLGKTISQNWTVLLLLSILTIVIGWFLSVYVNPREKQYKTRKTSKRGH
ncbi:MAG: YncE family protein [Candidatus Micrarchaeaceae archaeon]